MDPSKHLESLERRFFQEWVKRNPILGSSLGYHQDYDELMPDGTLHRELEDHKLFHRWMDEFSRVDPRKLPPAGAVEREYALWLLNLWTTEREEVRLWEHAPETGLTVGHALYRSSTGTTRR